jgi:Pyridine nucleotide-disulphide oxidoreductase
LDSEVVIVGAGPYGLSVGAHLQHRGISFQIFGKPMDTWRHHMPAGMLLKSDGFASSLSAPKSGSRLGDYCEEAKIPYGDREPRVTLQVFTDYALDFQRRFVPNLDPRMVDNLAPDDRGFRVRLEDGTEAHARSVVVAAGITHFANIPSTALALGDTVSHSSAHRTFDQFRGHEVAVLGAGSSAIEVAASLIDAGATVHLVARRPSLPFWTDPSTIDSSTLPWWSPWWERIRNPPSGLGSGLRNKFCEDLPDLFRTLPAGFRLEVVKRHLGPVSGWWLRDKVLNNANIRTGTDLAEAYAMGDKAVLTLVGEDGIPSELIVDHVVAATGYAADIDRLPFLPGTVRRSLRRIGTMPELSHAFQSSIPGLYFTGIAAAGSFGPLMRFMVGAEYAAPRVAAHLNWRRRAKLLTR